MAICSSLEHGFYVCLLESGQKDSMSTTLLPGDPVVFVSESGLKLRGVVSDTLGLKVRGEALLVPVIRPRKGKATCFADHDGRERQLKTRWLERSRLRKLPG